MHRSKPNQNRTQPIQNKVQNKFQGKPNIHKIPKQNIMQDNNLGSNLISDMETSEQKYMNHLLHGKPDTKAEEALRLINIIKAEREKRIAAENELAIGNFTNIDYFLSKGTTGTIEYAFEWAAYHGKLDIVKKTIKMDVNISNSKCIALQMASRNGHLDVVVYLLQLCSLNDYFEPNILIEAVENNHITIVDYLLTFNSKIGGDLIDVNAEYGLALRMAVQSENVAMVKLLIDHGCNVNALEGMALIIASRIGNVDIAQLLLDCGMDVQSINASMKIANYKNNTELINLLQQHLSK